jgi:hypothetical protein
MNGMKCSIANVARLSFSLFLISYLVGCNQSSQALADGYVLERFEENGKYYVFHLGDKSSGGGVFDGTIEKIGCKGDWILAQVERLSSNDTNGWYALNVKTRQLIGPIPSGEVRTNTELSAIKCYNCDQVLSGKWKK